MTKKLLQQALDALVYHTQQTRPIGRTKDAIAALEVVLAQPVQPAQFSEKEQPCTAHPDAPHGFDRNASHSNNRYTCDCESWLPT